MGDVLLYGLRDNAANPKATPPGHARPDSHQKRFG